MMTSLVYPIDDSDISLCCCYSLREDIDDVSSLFREFEGSTTPLFVMKNVHEIANWSCNIYKTCPILLIMKILSCSTAEKFPLAITSGIYGCL